MNTAAGRPLAQLAAAEGTAVPCAGNLPVDIDDPGFAWFIEAGAVDLFLVERRDGVEQSAPQHLLRAGAGRLLAGVSPLEEDGTTLGLVAKGLPGTVLRRIPAGRLAALDAAELAGQVDAWLMDVSRMLSRDVLHRPQAHELVEAGRAAAETEGTLSTRHGVVWVTGLRPGRALFMDLIDPAENAPGDDAGRPLPLTPATWLSLADATEIATQSSQSLAAEQRLLPALAGYHATALALERLNRSLAAVDQANVERARVSSRRGDEEGARRSLFNLYGLLETEAAGESALRDALRLIGRHAGIRFRWPAATPQARPADIIAGVLDRSGVRGRQVRLAVEHRWWVGDSGAMLAFRKEDNRPVVLLPAVWGNYREVDPVSGRARRITAERAALLHAHAWLFYPAIQALSARRRDMFGLARTGAVADLLRFLATGLLNGLIMLLPAVAIGFVADTVIPRGESGLLFMLAAALVAFALVRGLLHVLQGMALMRFEGRVTSRMEAALWDRLLRLPPRFLRRYPAGELAMRGMTFQNLRDGVQGILAGVLSVVFLSPAILVIFWYDALIGVLAAGFGLLSVATTVALGLQQIRPHRRMLRAVQDLTARMFQFINGISKLRMEGAEGSAFAVWAQRYRQQKQAELEAGAFETHLRAFNAALPLLAGSLLLLALALSGPGRLSVGGFLVAYTLLLLYHTAVVRLGESFGAIAAGVPAFSQVRPLLAEPPETSVEGNPVDALGGEVAFDHISFRYDAEGPLILDDVSLRARPGEFIAIAGQSGAGKSTLFRLALGLEAPAGGSVYYDGRDLRQLNLKQVRRQIGVVPQVVKLHPQDLWDNIVGDHEEATAEDVWEAARLAAVDREIAAMPMGMLTPVGAGIDVTSGGEAQRIRLAHALVRKPSILLLDEATNWLDNDSQSTVMANLARLTSTRIVIAHRLSTLRHADRIYVMQSGKVVQEGTFAELEASPGAFRDLVRRQMA